MVMGCCEFIFAALLAVLVLSPAADSTRIRGTWKYDPDNRMKYLTKFGVQTGHDVIAYGRSVRSRESHVGFNDALVLAFVPSSTWKRFYDIEKKDKRTCQDFMAGPFNASRSPDSRCSNPGTADLYRVVPCDYQLECKNQFGPPVPSSNLTFRITSPRTQFYYLFLVGCHQNSTVTGDPCTWATSDAISIDYNIHIVNQDPELTREPDPMIYEFSYDLIGLMIIYIIFFCIYFTLAVFQLLIHSCLCTPHGYKHHRLTVIFSVSLVLETLHVLLIMIHYCVFSKDGVGVTPLFYIGQAANFFSDWLLILVLILIGKGWQITTATVRWKKVTLVVWILYIVVSGVFLVWIMVMELAFPFSSEQRDVHQTWAGGLYLAYRLLLLLYIMWEMRQIYLIENRRFKLILYRLLAVLYVVWFCYLPVAVVIATILNPLERARVIAVFVLTFDLIVNVVMVLLMCPKWSQVYFQFSSHLNSLTRVTMRKMKTRYHAVGDSFTSDDT